MLRASDVGVWLVSVSKLIGTALNNLIILLFFYFLFFYLIHRSSLYTLDPHVSPYTTSTCPARNCAST